MDAITKIGKIDLKGQKLAENMGVALIVSSAAISLVVGKVTDNMLNTVYTYLAGIVLTVLVVAFPLPMYNKNPIKWLDAEKSETSKK
ncbi:hypothetical protein BB561_001135 [Smittium simulii]|uniref:Signal peptidase complex subunit 1 n=1 Tax=Smittium simulii TaxID=133385 RepID=A0A2T9YW24_9FUNG|nr:hypothetical protein BB561_001135 [Smittium simulii]